MIWFSCLRDAFHQHTYWFHSRKTLCLKEHSITWSFKHLNMFFHSPFDLIMTLAKRRSVVNKRLACSYEMFYRNFLSLNVLKGMPRLKGWKRSVGTSTTLSKIKSEKSMWTVCEIGKLYWVKLVLTHDNNINSGPSTRWTRECTTFVFSCILLKDVTESKYLWIERPYSSEGKTKLWAKLSP